MSKELLIKSAETIEALEATVADLTTKLAAANAEKVTLAEAVQAKTASVTEDEKSAAARAEVAKTAAAKLAGAGLFSNDEKRDAFAARITGSHIEAIQALTKVAGHVPAKIEPQGRVVVKEGGEVKTADQTWDDAIRKNSSVAG